MGDNLSWVKQVLHNTGNETNKVDIFVQYETNMWEPDSGKRKKNSVQIQQASGAEEQSTHLVQFDDVGVIQHLHDLNFPVDLLQVDCIQLGLVNNLYGHLQRESEENLISRCSARKLELQWLIDLIN